MRILYLVVFSLCTAVPLLAAPKNGMAVIPEPGSTATIGVALAGLAFYWKKNRK